MANIESAYLRNANCLISNDLTLRAGLLKVRLSEPLSKPLPSIKCDCFFIKLSHCRATSGHCGEGI